VTFDTPSHLTHIPDRLFLDCVLLKTLHLPDSVTNIAGSAFSGSGVTSVTGADCVMRDSLLIRHGTILHCFGSPSQIIIPSTVREIGNEQFVHARWPPDLRFEEGLERIGSCAFGCCHGLQTIAFPASLKVIGEGAFFMCWSLRRLTFAAGSQLECIQKYAFGCTSLEAVVIPGTVKEIDPFSFEPGAWRLLKFEGRPHILVKGKLLFSRDSRILLRSFPDADYVVIPAGIEAIGPKAFTGPHFGSDEFSSQQSSGIQTVIVPSSLETIGDRCFEECSQLTEITFRKSSKLKRIGERAFAKSRITSITIPASTEEIDGSAFVGCYLQRITIAPGNRHFRMEGFTLVTAEGVQIVRFFGGELTVIVPAKVEILGKSCFEACNQLEGIDFENGSQLRIIDRSALSNCGSLRSISIPATVEEIGEAAFKDCTELESCLIAKNGNLGRIGKEAFSGCETLMTFYVPRSVHMIGEKCFELCTGLESCLIDENAILWRIGKETFRECHSLRSFSVPNGVEAIGEKCFKHCRSLYRLGFVSGESLKQFVGDRTLDEALENMGLDELNGLFRIEIGDGGVCFEFPDWSSVADESSH
jgi:hypothetical protein